MTGRIWVWLFQPSRRDTIPEVSRATTAKGVKNRWSEPTVYDVFAADGNFLGAIELPADARFGASRADKLWVITRDSLDVERLIRYRVDWRRQ